MTDTLSKRSSQFSAFPAVSKAGTEDAGQGPVDGMTNDNKASVTAGIPRNQDSEIESSHSDSGSFPASMTDRSGDERSGKRTTSSYRKDNTKRSFEQSLISPASVKQRCGSNYGQNTISSEDAPSSWMSRLRMCLQSRRAPSSTRNISLADYPGASGRNVGAGPQADLPFLRISVEAGSTRLLDRKLFNVKYDLGLVVHHKTRKTSTMRVRLMPLAREILPTHVGISPEWYLSVSNDSGLRNGENWCVSLVLKDRNDEIRKEERYDEAPKELCRRPLYEVRYDQAERTFAIHEVAGDSTVDA